MPVDELKLDRSFVPELAHNESAMTLAGAVMSIGESLNLGIVAEGVETDIKRQIQQARGCKVVQGFLYARPMAADELPAWIASWIQQTAHR